MKRIRVLRLATVGALAIAGASCTRVSEGAAKTTQTTATPAQPALARVATGTPLQSEVPVQLVQGTFEVPVSINDAIVLNFTIDSGAADVSIPADVVSTLVRTGTITKDDFIGEQTYVLADGTEVPSAVFRIRKLKVGTLVLRNVRGSLANAKAPLLLGQSFLSRLTTWSIDNERQVLLLKTSSAEAEQAADAVASSANAPAALGVAQLLSQEDVEGIAVEFDETLKASGMLGVSEKVETCYASLSSQDTELSRRRAAYCITFDLLGLRYDAAFRGAMAERTGSTVPPTDFYEDAAWKARVARYLPMTTPAGETPEPSAIAGHVRRAERALVALHD